MEIKTKKMDDGTIAVVCMGKKYKGEVTTEKKVLYAINNMGNTFTKSEITRKTQWINRYERQEAIDNLINSGMIIKSFFVSPESRRRTIIYRKL